ncbi:hypothetical protein P4646_05270 [Peribacillus simplex]|uniref:hypothetical protein n=1 Tax=Peribacillus simplex TaxID=1478 RepID=UPI002E1F4F6C|nr:hypothetical protein [Peribacillus simplex]MED4096994.1 hypothetical protein [Peribacillus simplex]
MTHIFFPFNLPLYFGFSSNQHEIDEINLFYTIVEEYINLLKSLRHNELGSAYEYACLFLIWKNTKYFIEEDTYLAMSRYFYFNTKKLNKGMMNRLKKLDKIDNYEERKFEFRLILHELVNQEIEENDKEELLDTFFEIGPEINDAIGISIYTDLASPGFGPLPISYRKQYRENILRELYNSKYYTSDYNFKFNSGIQ